MLTYSFKVVESLLVASLARTILGSVSSCIQRISFADTTVPIKRYIVRIILIIVSPDISDFVLSSGDVAKYLH